jgi:cytochrome c1
MRLKMQTFMLLGAKRFDTVQTLKSALETEKVNWFPIFKDNTCQGQLQIKTQFIKEDVMSIINGGSMVYEGGKDKPAGWTVQRVRTGILCAGIATAATVGIWTGFDDPMSGMTEEEQTQLAAIGTML